MFTFETNRLKALHFQEVETERAFNTRGQPDVFNLHLRLTALCPDKVPPTV